MLPSYFEKGKKLPFCTTRILEPSLQCSQSFYRYRFVRYMYTTYMQLTNIACLQQMQESRKDFGCRTCEYLASPPLTPTMQCAVHPPVFIIPLQLNILKYEI